MEGVPMLWMPPSDMAKSLIETVESATWKGYVGVGLVGIACVAMGVCIKVDVLFTDIEDIQPWRWLLHSLVDGCSTACLAILKSIAVPFCFIGAAEVLPSCEKTYEMKTWLATCSILVLVLPFVADILRLWAAWKEFAIMLRVGSAFHIMNQYIILGYCIYGWTIFCVTTDIECQTMEGMKPRTLMHWFLIVNCFLSSLTIPLNVCCL
eukprot:gnl/TRDRNA2_/TRDRNA2_175483_c3_seq1.p1 gnl/TRDRNA2_/TRDRNA2_175483_c3~~gnl/TRDRNA2_/TRDRNA2_175483_c3_seq1.p1  ORF type:complete len:233 (+),score=26.40 gnl/TRDRNA2_/TRDRNA2_175483_c3_seq1:77-700(+)